MKFFRSYLFIALLALGFSSCSDDEPIEVEVVSQVAPQSITYRIDKVTVNFAGSNWIGEDVNILVADDKNSSLFNTTMYVYNTASPIERLAFGAVNQSAWRVFVYTTYIDRAPGFMLEIDPTAYRSADGTFSIPIINPNNSSYSEMDITLSGKVISS